MHNLRKFTRTIIILFHLLYMNQEATAVGKSPDLHFQGGIEDESEYEVLWMVPYVAQIAYQRLEFISPI